MIQITTNFQNNYDLKRLILNNLVNAKIKIDSINVKKPINIVVS